jgi:large subunit ribosomal protein L21
MYAIIETGGKQYKVAEGDVLKVELLDNDVDQTVDIDRVLAVGEDGQLKVGNPTVANAKVTLKVLEHGKGKKVIVFHYKPKKQIRKKNGHRQPYTKVQVEKIYA